MDNIRGNRMVINIETIENNDLFELYLEKK